MSTYLDFLNQKKAHANSFSKFREESFRRFKVSGFPSKKHEAWKYINLEPVLGLEVETEKAPCELDEQKLKSYFLDDEAHDRLVFANGCFVESLSQQQKNNAFELSVLANAPHPTLPLEGESEGGGGNPLNHIYKKVCKTKPIHLLF